MASAQGIKSAYNHDMLKIVLLGEFKLSYGGASTPNFEAPHQSLLIYLLLNPGKRYGRQQLAFQFWPDSTEAQARTNLRKAIFHLRRKLPQADQYLYIDRQTIYWRAEGAYSIDKVDFERALAQAESARGAGDQAQTRACLETAAAIYGGDLLPSHYEDWVLVSRERLHLKYLDCLEQLILLLENERTYPAAIHYARKLLRADPLHEATYRRLIRLQALNGDIASALHTYHDCATVLQRELGVPPSLSTQEAYERLLNIETRVEPLPERVPMVARADAWDRLQANWRAIDYQAGVVWVTGEAGIGKTRLADEFIDWANRQGFSTLSASCYPSGGRLPYAPLVTWLRSETFAPILEKLEAHWLEELSRLLPELLVNEPALSAPRPLAEDWQQQYFFTALGHAITRLAQPLLLFLDDLQLCDQDTLDWLHFLLHFDEGARFLLLGAVRSEEVPPDHPLKAWQQQLEHQDRFTEIALDRLDSDGTNLLATRVASRTLEPELAARLFNDTEGVPLFIVETARSGFQFSGHANPASTGAFPSSIGNLPGKVRAVIETRLSQLSPSAQALAQLASVIGRSFTFQLLAQASRQDQESFVEEDFVRDLDELWQRRIIRERGHDAYDFSHDKLRQVAYTNLSAPRRRLLHRRIALALSDLHRDDLQAVSSQLAAHYDAAGQAAEAIQYYQQAAQISRRIFAHQETRHHLARAIALLPEAPSDDGFAAALYERLGDVLALTGKSQAAHQAFETALSLTDSALCQSRLYRKIADTCQARRDFEAAFQAWDRSEERLERVPGKNEDPWQQEWLQIQLDRMWGHHWAAQVDALNQLANQIKTPIEKYGTISQRGLYYQRLYLLSLRKYRYVIPDESLGYARISLAAIEESGDLSQIASARFNLGFANLWHGWRGHLEQAEFFLKDALELAEKIGDSVLQVRCLNYLLVVYRKQGWVARAKSLLPRALDLAQKNRLIEYVAYIQGSHSWVAYREGDFPEAGTAGQQACDLINQFTRVLPCNWIVYWPTLAVALSNNRLGAAVSYAQGMLEPDQHRFPDRLAHSLQGAISAWENEQPDLTRTELERSLQLAHDFRYI